METPKWALPVALAGGGLIVGFTAGYFVGKKTRPAPSWYTVKEEVVLDVKEIKEVEEEPEETSAPVVIEKVVIDAEAFEEQIKAKEQLNREIKEIHQRELERTRRQPNNIFTEDSTEVWDYDQELLNRDPNTPYIIHKDEFIENEHDYSQETLTYYAGDEIMADPHDTPLYGWFDMMGPLKFGYGSEDPNVVYIRNDTLHYEWEVLKHNGRFEVEVGGLTIEDEYTKQDLKHSNSPRKFREF